MISLSRKFFLGATACALALVTRADIIVDQPSTAGSVQVLAFDPLGQSFTAASNKLISFDFDILTYNPTFANHALRLDILQGSGTGGLVLDTATFSLASGFNGLAGATFNLDVIAGGIYTAVLTTDTVFWGVSVNGSDVYAGGNSFYNGHATGGDLVFRATFADATVPDGSSTILLLGGALTSLAVARRRFRS